MSVKQTMTTLAEVIRKKTGKSGTLDLDQMAEAVAGISIGTGNRIKSVACITTASNGALLGDIDGDGIISSADQVQLTRFFTESESNEGADRTAADINADGELNLGDLVAFSQAFTAFDDSKKQIIGRVEITYNSGSTGKYHIPVEI